MGERRGNADGQLYYGYNSITGKHIQKLTKIYKARVESSSSQAIVNKNHERLLRLDSSSSSDVSNDTSTNLAESYFLRRENRLSAKKRAEEEKMNSDYKQMYEKALATNQRLKFRLETSKQDLATVQDQLQRAQVCKFSLFLAIPHCIIIIVIIIIIISH
ncbi:hypothetical protein ILYODFUR_019173 [Ilyodon furcidens]|uniref:cGMP-dependent protein kinase interacting domain-containing protein n=1 Tax=Ilyodon furcidens TaxID=33524 RepID=A0ABV0TVX4_9TELE